MKEREGLTQEQYDQLLKPLAASRVATRSGGGRQLSYLESWDVKAHLIRIFGFGGWSWEVTTAELAFEDQNEKKQWNVGYKVVGCLSIHSLGIYGANYTEAAVGFATLPSRGEAHDMAIKTAESDALKRAAINLGTQFGLSLYNNGSREDVVKGTLAGPGVKTVEEVPVQNVDSMVALEWIGKINAASDEDSLETIWDELKKADLLTAPLDSDNNTLGKMIGERVAIMRGNS